MIKPFHQGKLDAFCAMYAVLNAYRLLCGMRTTKARDILNTTLLSLGARPAKFQQVLTMNTDYIWLVDEMLDTQLSMLRLSVERPWPENGVVTLEDFWKCAENRLAIQGTRPVNNVMVFRFMRHLKPDLEPVNRHWTCSAHIEGDVLRLFDCSHEAEAILNIKKESIATRREDVNAEKLLHIQPESVRFISLARASK